MEGHFTQPSKFGKPGLGIAPEAFDSIDMTFYPEQIRFARG